MKPAPLSQNLPFFQQAYLVNDLDAAITHWHTTFGAGPFVKAEPVSYTHLTLPTICSV